MCDQSPYSGDSEMICQVFLDILSNKIAVDLRIVLVLGVCTMPLIFQIIAIFTKNYF